MFRWPSSLALPSGFRAVTKAEDGRTKSRTSTKKGPGRMHSRGNELRKDKIK